MLDHDDTLTEPDIEARLVGEAGEQPLEFANRLATGARFSFSIGAKTETIVRVAEQCIDLTQVQLVAASKQKEKPRIDWLENNLVSTNGPLANDKGIQDCLRIQQEVAAIEEELAAAIKETERLAARQDRLRQNIKTGGQDELTNRWRTELDEAERAIKSIEEEKLPGLREKRTACQRELTNALKQLSAEWSDESGQNTERRGLFDGSNE